MNSYASYTQVEDELGENDLSSLMMMGHEVEDEFDEEESEEEESDEDVEEEDEELEDEDDL